VLTCTIPRDCKCAYRVRSCERSVSVVAGARISILYTDRISPAPANYTRQFSERSSWPVGRSVGSLELTLRVPAYVSLSPRYPSHYSSFRGSYLRVTLCWPLTCALCVCLNRTTVYSCRETASTSLTVIDFRSARKFGPSIFHVWFTWLSYTLLFSIY